MLQCSICFLYEGVRLARPKLLRQPRSASGQFQGVVSGSLRAKDAPRMIAMNDTMTAATTQVTNFCTTAAKGAQDYNNKVVAFAQANTNSAFDFLQRLSGVKTPSEFMELSTTHARKQFEVLTEQAKELAALAQKVTTATTEPLKAGVTKALNTAA